MKYFIFGAVFLMAFLQPRFVIAQDVIPVIEIYHKNDIVKYIKTYTALFGSSANVVYSVNMCEGGPNGHHGDIKNGVPNSFGWFAYFPETWDRYSKRYRNTFGVDDKFDIKSVHDQVKLTSWVYSLGEVNKNEWTTYRAITRGGIYTFYSKFHDRWFTVKCGLQKIPSNPQVVFTT